MKKTKPKTLIANSLQLHDAEGKLKILMSALGDYGASIHLIGNNGSRIDIALSNNGEASISINANDGSTKVSLASSADPGGCIMINRGSVESSVTLLNIAETDGPLIAIFKDDKCQWSSNAAVG